MIKFSDEKLKKVDEIIARYPQGKQKSALLPVLHLAQEEFGGWLSVETMDYVAQLLKLEPIEVYEGQRSDHRLYQAEIEYWSGRDDT
jgi:NADH-quinone oxidoreductase subunit E